MNALQRAVDACGSQSELARRLKKKPGHVWAWLHRDGKVPPGIARAIEDATGGLVKRHELRPDIFDPPAEAVSTEEGAR